MTNLFKISSAFNKDKELTQKAHRLLWICLAVSLVTAAIQFFGPLAARQYLDQISTANILTACAIILGSFLSVGLLQLLFLLYKYKSGVHIKASMLGEKAALAIISGATNVVFGFNEGKVVGVNLFDAVNNTKTLNPELVRLARVLA